MVDWLSHGLAWTHRFPYIYILSLFYLLRYLFFGFFGFMEMMLCLFDGGMLVCVCDVGGGWCIGCSQLESLLGSLTFFCGLVWFVTMYTYLLLRIRLSPHMNFDSFDDFSIFFVCAFTNHFLYYFNLLTLTKMEKNDSRWWFDSISYITYHDFIIWGRNYRKLKESPYQQLFLIPCVMNICNL